MQREDFLKLVGATTKRVELLPAAFLLRSGYGCFGHFHVQVNEGLSDTCVLLNARLVELRGTAAPGRAAIHDFDEFLAEVVSATFADSASESSDVDDAAAARTLAAQRDIYGRTIPLMAIGLDEIAVFYPVAQIGALLARAREDRSQLPTFFDIDQSLVVRLLRTKIW